jgi:hypothetical protein
VSVTISDGHVASASCRCNLDSKIMAGASSTSGSASVVVLGRIVAAVVRHHSACSSAAYRGGCATAHLPTYIACVPRICHTRVDAIVGRTRVSCSFEFAGLACNCKSPRRHQRCQYSAVSFIRQHAALRVRVIMHMCN